MFNYLEACDVNLTLEDLVMVTIIQVQQWYFISFCIGVTKGKSEHFIGF